MAANDDVLIVGKLDSKELEKSIESLVDYVGNQTTVMAGKFTTSMDLMKSAMKDFAVSQKVSVDLMKESWKTMSASFDAMFAAQSAATGGGTGSGKPTYPDNTVGALEEEIKLEEQKRKKMQLSSDELERQNKLLETQKKLLQLETTSSEKYQLKQNDKMLGTIYALSTKTLPQAQEKLRQLIELQDRFRNSGIYDKKQWNRLETAIDNVQTKIENLKKKGATGSTGGGLTNLLDIKNLMPEETIDDITRKMKALRSVKAQDAAETQALSSEYQRLKRKQHELMGSSIQLTKSNNYLAQSFGYIRNRIAYALTLGAVTNFTKQIYEIRGQYELLERSLGVLVNSFERGSQVFQELNKMAIESPFTLFELASGAKQLTAYNFAADEVVDTTRRLADISSALGVPMERLVYNLGQIRAQTILNARDARDFANAGLPIVKMLSNYYTELEGKVVSTGEVYSRMSKKMVSYNDVMTVINKTTDQGGKFFEFQAKQAQTLRVQMANLTLAWNNMLNEMGEGNQGLLSLPIKALKAMLQEWSSINRVIKNLVLSFGLMKAAQLAVIASMPKMNLALASTAVLGEGITKTIIGVGKALKGLFTNPWTWVFVGIAAITDLIGKWRAARQEIEELNQKIVDTSKEASQANVDFLNNKGNKETRKLAKENQLSAEAADKAWGNIEEQIKTSSDAAQTFLTTLWGIDDVNKRVSEGFDYVERIQKAQAALQDLQSDAIKVTQDKGWFGMFGEGLVSDLKDLKDQLKGIGRELDLFDNEGRVNANLGARWAEYRDELEETAKSINDFIKQNNITDPLQIAEILGRVKTIIKEKNPEIKGELESLFDVTLDKRVAYLTGGAIDSNLSLWKQFMERLKHNSSATFQDITREWATNDEKLSKEQQDAIDANLEYFKNTMPFYYESVKNMVADASKLKIQIGLIFNPQSITDFQKQVKDRISKASHVLDFGNQTMWGTQNDDLTSWVGTQQKAIKDLRADNKLLAKDQSQWAKDQIAANDREIQQRKNLLDLFHQSYEADKKTRGGAKKDVLGEAITKEIQLITDIRKRYNEYLKMGVNSQDALTKATNEYGVSLKNIKDTLAKFGITGLEGIDVANMDMRELVEKFKEMRKIAEIAGNTKGVEALENAIASLNVEITKIDYKRIVDGLNNELGRLKDEYELAVELDANPELGNIFADMWGINMETLPHTVNEYAERVTNELNKRLSALGNTMNLPNLLTLTNDDMKAFEDMVNNEFLNEEQYKLIKKAVESLRDALKKDYSETRKEWERLLQKYAEYEYRITQISQNANQERLNLVKQFGNDVQKTRALQLSEQINTEIDPQKKALFVEKLKKLVNDISNNNEIAFQIKVAIDKNETEETTQESFKEFQKNPEWIVATGNLVGMTHNAIGGLIKDLEDYRKKASNLSPKQIKQLNNALKSLYEQQRKANPFKFMSMAILEAKNRMLSYDDEIQNTIDKLKIYGGESADVSEMTKEEAEQYKKLSERLKELRRKREEAGKVSTQEVLDGILSINQAVTTAIGLFSDLASAIGGGTQRMSGTADALTKIANILSKTAQGAQTGSAFGTYGAIIGAVIGAATGIISQFKDVWNGQVRINNQLKLSADRVAMLTTEYNKLQHAIDDSYGMEAVGYQKLTLLNKQRQLSELERQLELEKSRAAKNRDLEKIEELENKVEEARYELKNATREMVQDLIGIGDAQDWANNFVSSMIDAFRKGEDYMEEYDTSFQNMVDNLIAKAIAGKLIGEKMEEWLSDIEQMQYKNAEETPAVVAAKAKMDELQHGVDVLVDLSHDNVDVPSDVLDNAKKSLWEAQKKYEEAFEKASDLSTMDVASLRENVNNWRQDVKEDFEEYMELFGIIYGSDKAKSELSALQQGIQGITEEQAGALEAYWNANTQQQYLQSDLLTQIRDIIMGYDLDVQVATMSQMLFQLQESYALMQTMASMMSNWQTPSGNGIRVELLN